VFEFVCKEKKGFTKQKLLILPIFSSAPKYDKSSMTLHIFQEKQIV